MALVVCRYYLAWSVGWQEAYTIWNRCFISHPTPCPRRQLASPAVWYNVEQVHSCSVPAPDLGNIVTL